MMDNLSLGKEFDEMTAFLAEHKWMFDFKLTHIFQDCVFNNTPEEVMIFKSHTEVRQVKSILSLVLTPEFIARLLTF